MNKTFTTGLILGVCGIVAILAGYFTIKTVSTVDADHAVLSQIVQLINSSQKQTGTTPAPASK